MRSRSRVLGTALVATILVLTTGPLRAELAGRSLVDALEELRDSGLRLIYSSDLVRPEMQVEEEPHSETLHGMLEELLSPHGLVAVVGPEGTILVVRDTSAPPRVEIESPAPEESVFGRVRLAARIESATPIARVEFRLDDRVVAHRSSPPWESWVDAGPENRDRIFTVLAYNRAGAAGEASLLTREVSVDESFSVTLREIYVTVDHDRKVPHLRRQDFHLYDGGMEQRIVTFESGTLPVTAVILLDASESMRGEPLRAAVGGARSFLSQLLPDDRSTVFLFADRTLAATPLQRGIGKLPEELGRAEAGGSTALNDHLYAALELLERKTGRGVVVLLSDGGDVASVLGIRDVLWKIRRSDVMVYWIHLASAATGGSFTSSWRNLEGHQEEWKGLETAVEESGGRIETVAELGSIDRAFAGILEELRQQYVLGYYPTQSSEEGAWRKLRVRVDLPGARVRVRSGYVEGRT